MLGEHILAGVSLYVFSGRRNKRGAPVHGWWFCRFGLLGEALLLPFGLLQGSFDRRAAGTAAEDAHAVNLQRCFGLYSVGKTALFFQSAVLLLVMWQQPPALVSVLRFSVRPVRCVAQYGAAHNVSPPLFASVRHTKYLFCPLWG